MGGRAKRALYQGTWTICFIQNCIYGNRARASCRNRHHWLNQAVLAFAQVDLDMLNVSLGTGTLEICSALLNTQYLSAQLVHTARSGYMCLICSDRSGAGSGSPHLLPHVMQVYT